MNLSLKHTQTQANATSSSSAELLAPISVIPQRPPFLFVDHIVQGEAGKFALSSYQVKHDHPVFAGHFPEMPIWPGVLLIENMAQTACWVMAAAQSADGAETASLYVLVRVYQCTFKRLVRPGDVLLTHAELVRDLGQFCIFNCDIKHGAELVANAELLVARRPPEAAPSNT